MSQISRILSVAAVLIVGIALSPESKAYVLYSSQSEALQACMVSANGHLALYGRPPSQPACRPGATDYEYVCYGPSANGAQTIGCSGKDAGYAWPRPVRARDPVRTEENLGQCNNCLTESAAFGDPINGGTGNKYEQRTEFAAAGESLLSFDWTYNSLGSSATAVPSGDILGLLRKTTFSRQVGLNTAGDRAYVSRPDGSSVEFVASGSQWTPSLGERGQLLRNSGAWLYTDTAGNEEHFDSSGRLLSYNNRSGSGVSVHYDTSGRIDYATDTQSRKLEFTYDANGRLQSLALPDGTTLTFSYTPAGFLKDVTYPDASVITYQYDDSVKDKGSLAGSLTSVIDETGLPYSLTYYDAGSRATTTRLGTGIGLEWAQYQPSTVIPGTMEKAIITTADGKVRTQEYDVRNGRVITISSTESCSLCEVENASYTLDSIGFLSQAIRRNVAENLQYDSRGRLTQRHENAYSYTGLSRITQTDWHASFDVPTERRVFDGSNVLVAKSTWSYNSRGQVLTSSAVDVASSASRTQTYEYCEATGVSAGTCPREGLFLSSDGPLAGAVDKTTYTYYPADAPTCASSPSTCPYRKGDLWVVTNAAGHLIENLKYDGAGRVLSMRDANGVVVDQQYHARGWPTATLVRGPDNSVGTDDAITRIEYWPTGLVKRVTLPDGAFTQYAYDQAHRLTEVSDNAGNTIVYTLNNAGRKTKEETKDSNGALTRTLSRVFNQAGKIKTLTDSRSYSTGITYDGDGTYEVTTDALGRVTGNYFDPLKRLTSTMQDRSGIKAETKFEYDALDNLTKVVDPKGLSTTYTYNALGDLSQLSSPDTGVTGYTYDAAGNRATQTDARGITSTYSYDGLGRITGITYPTAALNVGYVYDNTQAACDVGETYSIGRLTRMDDASGNTQYCYNRFGYLARKVQTTNGIAFTVRYLWSTGGQMLGMVYPDGTEVDYSRNALGQITGMGVTRPGQAREVLLDQVTYLPFGPTTGWTYGNGRVMTRTYDQDYRPIAIQDASPGGLSLGFGYDAVGNLTKLGTATGVATPDIVFGYDALGRLTRTADGPTNVAIDTYTYDKTGNRLTHVTAAGTSAYTYPATSHRLESVAGSARTYDTVGNTLTIGGREFGYSDANRMSQVKNGGNVAMNYAYNGRGQQVRRHLGSLSIYTAYDELGQWLGEYYSNGTPIQQALWMDDMPVGLIANGGQLHLLEPDHLGSPRVAIEVTRNLPVWNWDLSGEAFGATQPNEDADGDSVLLGFDMRFPGHRNQPETGMSNGGARNYESGSGRYATSDPTGQSGGPNTYLYALAAPTSWIDSDGRQAQPRTSPPARPPYQFPRGPAANDSLFRGSGTATAVRACLNPLVLMVAVGTMVPSPMTNCDRPDKPLECNEGDDECIRHQEKILRHVAGMKMKLNEMLLDPLNLYERAREFNPGGDLYGYGTWNGHQIRFEGLRAGLKNMIDEARKKLCAIPPEAWEMLYLPKPLFPYK